MSHTVRTHGPSLSMSLMIMEVSLYIYVSVTFYLASSVFIYVFLWNLDIFFEIPDDGNILEDPGASNPVVSVSLFKCECNVSVHNR